MTPGVPIDGHYLQYFQIKVNSVINLNFSATILIYITSQVTLISNLHVNIVNLLITENVHLFKTRPVSCYGRFTKRNESDFPT